MEATLSLEDILAIYNKYYVCLLAIRYKCSSCASMCALCVRVCVYELLNRNFIHELISSFSSFRIISFSDEESSSFTAYIIIRIYRREYSVSKKARLAIARMKGARAIERAGQCSLVKFFHCSLFNDVTYISVDYRWHLLDVLYLPAIPNSTIHTQCKNPSESNKSNRKKKYFFNWIELIQYDCVIF